MPFVLFLLGAAAVALVASQASAKTPGASGGGRTYTLDKNLPPQLRQRVLAALATEKSPAALLAFAADCASQGYPLSAAALSQRAVELGGLPLPQPQPGPGPQPGRINPVDPGLLPDPPRTEVLAALATGSEPNALEALAQRMDAQGYTYAAQALRLKETALRSIPQPGPQPGPAPSPQPGVNPIDPGMLPDPPRAQVLAALSSGTDPNALEALAQRMDAQGYTYAAQALRLKETALRSLPQPGPQPSPSPSPGPQPGPPAPPAPNPFTLDPGMPPQMQSAVLGALTTEQDPAKLQAFAQAIQAQYPIAAGLLMAKANALRLPTPVTPPSPGPTPAGGLPIGDDSTRTGRNAGRPAGYPFIHLHGESTYPAKIAKQATGSEASYPQMTRLNPQFAPDGVHWKNIQTGDALNVPWAWVPKLTGLYTIKIDPGVAPPGVLAVASTALAKKGGSNGLAAHA